MKLQDNFVEFNTSYWKTGLYQILAKESFFGWTASQIVNITYGEKIKALWHYKPLWNKYIIANYSRRLLFQS